MAASTLHRTLEAVMLSVVLGWISIWVLRPTKLWKKSWRSAEVGMRKTFLGDRGGIDIIVFCYPVLSVAALGYLSQHLLRKKGRRVRNRNGERRTPRWIDLSSPVIIGCSPIGMVSGGQLLAALLFASLLLWTIYRYVSSDFHKLAPEESLHLSRLQHKVMRVGIRFGCLIEICMALLFLPVLRGMALFKIIGTQFEASVRYHVWIANILILFAVLHGGSIMFIWADNQSFWSEITRWQRTGRVYIAGAFTLATGLAIWITSLPPIRRKSFQLFYSAHHLYIIFITFYLFHCGDRHFYLISPGILLFALDKILRSLQSTPSPCLISARLLPCKAIQLTLSMNPSVKFNPTSILFVNVPSISRFHWHPFSIFTTESVDDNERMSMIIKCHGWWTKALYDGIQAMVDLEDDPSIKCPLIAVEGPYGPTENPIERYDSLILVAGGSGVTPLLSIIGEAASRKTSAPLSKVHLIYVVKRLEDLSMLSPISSLLSKRQTELFQLQLKAFVTQEERSGAAPNQILQEVFQMKTISFNPALPIDAARRPDGLLWKTTITALSSVVFLVVVIILSHIFVPTDRGAKGNYPSWINCLIVITSFVVATSSAMVGTFLQRRIGEEDMGAISHELVRTTGMSSGEVMGIAEGHEVHFGRRPDLAVVLEELSVQIGKSRVGVFVCGPNAMQESAARFCRKNSPTFCGNSIVEKPRFEFHSLNFSL